MLFRSHIRQPGFVTLYKDAMLAGLYLLLHPLTRDLLIFLGIASRQLTPNCWRFLMRAIHFWPQRFWYELSLQEILWTYRPFSLFREVGFFSLQARQGRKIIDKCLSSNTGWKLNFFYISTLGFYEETPEGHPLPTDWAGKLRVRM